MRKDQFLKILMSLIVYLTFAGCAGPPKSSRQSLLDDMYPILSAAQYDTLRSLADQRDINQFLDNFWQAVDTLSGSPAGGLKSEYLRRLEYANENYPDRRGWGRSDRKRIYLIYGPPEYIEREESANIRLGIMSTIKSLEIWIYMTPGKYTSFPTRVDNLNKAEKKFVFGDDTGSGNYILLYSSEDYGDTDVRMLK